LVVSKMLVGDPRFTGTVGFLLKVVCRLRNGRLGIVLDMCEHVHSDVGCVRAHFGDGGG
jgi:hypothetical protein